MEYRISLNILRTQITAGFEAAQNIVRLLSLSLQPVMRKCNQAAYMNTKWEPYNFHISAPKKDHLPYTVWCFFFLNTVFILELCCAVSRGVWWWAAAVVAQVFPYFVSCEALFILLSANLQWFLDAFSADREFEVLLGVVDQESPQVNNSPIGTAGQHTSLHCRLLFGLFRASFISIRLLVFTAYLHQNNWHANRIS